MMARPATRHAAPGSGPRHANIILVAVILSSFGCSSPVDETAQPEAPRPAVAEGETHRSVELYFPGADGRLHAERRQMPVQENTESSIGDLIHALLEGPRSADLWAPLTLAPEPDVVEAGGQIDDEADREAGAASEDPQSGNAGAEADTSREGDRPPVVAGPPAEGVRVETVYLLADGTVVVNLASAAPPAIGTHQEAASLYSLVNTILLNTPDAERVTLLWNGLQRQTFAGHIDTARPLPADRSLIVAPPAASP